MEIWKDITGFESVYQVSNQGRVRSLQRTETDTKGRAVKYKGKVLKQTPNSRGYLRVELKSNGKKERWLVHRLVAIHFVNNPMPDVYTVVNHLDSNFLNNNATNLEWTSMFGNAQHAIENGRMQRTEEWLKHLRESNEKNGTAVIGVNKQTNEKIYFVCLNDCRNKGFQASCVCECCTGKRKTHKGFEWRYATPEEIENLLSLWEQEEKRNGFYH